MPAYQPFAEVSASEKRAQPVYLTVIVPSDAALWINGQHTQLAGPVRTFVGPALPAGDYFYELQAAWPGPPQLVTQFRRIAVRPGDVITVDFSEAVRKAYATPQFFP